MTSKELLAHPSVRRELERCRKVGVDALVAGNTIALYQNIVPVCIAEAFAHRIRALDHDGVLSVKVGTEVESRTVALLRKYGVPLETWGTGEAKTLEHLLTELAAGECRLVEQDGRLLRHAEGAVINVYCEGSDGRMKLIEDRQVFKDGRTKNRNLDTSIGEKMKQGEHPLAGARRALEEELGITVPLAPTPLGIRRKGPVPSVAFPGLVSLYEMHAFEVTLPPELVKPEGYVEHQDDKSTYFEWKPADGA